MIGSGWRSPTDVDSKIRTGNKARVLLSKCRQPLPSKRMLYCTTLYPSPPKSACGPLWNQRLPGERYFEPNSSRSKAASFGTLSNNPVRFYRVSSKTNPNLFPKSSRLGFLSVPRSV
jgi:hypothetical protein